ncbi:MAG: SpoVR family protein [Pirellulaceae bacterium]|nr:SpoVR family protein [Planctomycetales bacterium]
MRATNLRTLPPELVAVQDEMEQLATQYGLDYFPTIFEVVDVDQLNAIAAYGGFPTRYPHWRFGMEYRRLAKGYSYGLQKIYELVINNDPCYAYLLSSNSFTDHKMVIAHVYGHCDFFKKNYWFSKTNRHMIDEMANHGNRIRRYMDRFGREEVELFIDACLSVEDLIDIHSPFIQRGQTPAFRPNHDENHEEDSLSARGDRFQAKSYMDRFINPPQALAREAERKRAQREQATNFPDKPMRDVMGFLLEHAPLKPWQVDVLAIIRDEAYYFAPQGQTKIMNEGWATYWHTTLMTRHGLATGGDVVAYADHTSGTLASSPTRLNPYKLGVELFRDIEDRWNRGCHGRDYEDCDDMLAKQQWNTHDGVGREKIFEVRAIHNDLTFIDEFLTLDFCKRHNLFSFAYNAGSGHYEIESRKFQQIKQQLLFNLTNLGRPIISVIDGNFRNRGELVLRHQFNGPELKISSARDTLANVHRLWGRPVHIETVLENKRRLFSFDGADHTEQAWDGTPELQLQEES